MPSPVGVQLALRDAFVNKFGAVDTGCQCIIVDSAIGNLFRRQYP